MSFRDQLRQALENSALGLFDTWQGFYTACPLDRARLVKHDSRGNEVLAPDRDSGYYQTKFFGSDGLGVVWYENGVPVTGAVFRSLGPDAAEQPLRLGAPIKANGLRRAMWDIGCRRLVFHRLKTEGRNITRIRHNYQSDPEVEFLERDRPGLEDRYLTFEVRWKVKPGWKDYDPNQSN